MNEETTPGEHIERIGEHVTCYACGAPIRPYIGRHPSGAVTSWCTTCHILLHLDAPEAAKMKARA